MGQGGEINEILANSVQHTALPAKDLCITGSESENRTCLQKILNLISKIYSQSYLLYYFVHLEQGQIWALILQDSGSVLLEFSKKLLL